MMVFKYVKENWLKTWLIQQILPGQIHHLSDLTD